MTHFYFHLPNFHLDIPYDEHLEINVPNPKLIVLSDSSRYRKSFSDIGGNLLSPNGEGKSSNTTYVEAFARLSSSLIAYNELEVSLVSQDE